MLNGAPLNSAPLNGALTAGASPVPEPVYVLRGTAYVWRLRLLVGGLDLTAQLVGAADVDREEGAAGVAGFALYLPPGEPVVPPDWVGKAVSIDLISRDQTGTVTEARLYTGVLEMPAWNATSRLLSCECSDQQQQRVEGMSIEQIDALAGGYWSADVFEPVDGRSRWDYALERLSTRPASLDLSADGVPRVSGWFASSPHFVFGGNQSLYESVQIDLAPHGAVTNRVELEINYRYSRLWQHNQSFGWSHPQSGSSGITGFCNWRTWTSDLPTTDMIESAVTGDGLAIVGRVGGYKLPGSMANPCGDGVAWSNPFDNLWLAASVTGARRWVQTVTEHYRLSITAPGGETEATQVIARDSTSMEIETDRADEWGAGTPSGSGGAQDVTDEARRTAALNCLLQRARTQLIDAHRGTTVSWQVPTPMALGVDLAHTLQLADRALATGKCRRIQHSLDLSSGSAITTLSIAVMRGGGEGDPLIVPAAPDTSLPGISNSGGALPTQLGGRLNHPVTGLSIPPYDETRLGFSGNWDAKDDLTAADFPRRFDIEAVEIPAEYRDERSAETLASYRVSIPNDQLEL